MRKLRNTLFFVAYQIVRSMRYSLLLSSFGYISHCKHSPTCGTYFWRCWEKEGWMGVPKGLRRLASCW